MSCIDVNLTERRVSRIHGFVARLSRWWQVNQHRRSQRITAVALHSLDDRTLKDIGVDRSEIASLIYSNDRVPSCGRFGRPL
jgi:uncharacterized protein YjiS (DUF1127 family)